MPPRRLAAVLACGLLAVPGMALAQLPQPRIQGLYPSGGRAGETVEVTIHGTDLEGVDTLRFAHPGLRAFQRKGPTFVVAIAPGTPIGHHDARAVGPFGVSNPRTFVVGDRAESLEAEPNNTPAQANAVAINSVVNGRIEASPDVDCFAFEGKAGRRVFLDLAADRLDGRLDGVLRVLDPAGIEIAEAHDVYGPDPFLDLTLPADGRYVVKVHDVVYAGSADHPYRLTIHDGPHLDAIAPVVAASGVGAEFTLLGRQIGGTAAPDLAIDGRPLERLKLAWTPTASPAELLFGKVPSSAATRSGFAYRMGVAGGASHPVFVAEAADPVVIEAEPNDAGHPQGITPPCDVSGAFGAIGDVDVYRFSAKKGQVWWIEATAERLGSPADPAFVVQRVDGQGKAQDLATGDDDKAPPSAGNPRFPTSSVDALLRWQAPEDGTYQVVLNDLFNSQRGDARHSYRLNIRPERPDFRLFVVPDDPAQPGATNLGDGGRASATLVAAKLDGFDRPIRVEAVELPPGVSCEPVVLGPGQFSAPIVFTASAGAAPVVGRVRLVGRALSGDRKEVLDYAAGRGKAGGEIGREARSGAMVWPPVPNPTGAPPLAQARLADEFALAVRGREPAPFLLAAKETQVVAGHGESFEIHVEATRNPAMTEAIALTTADLPPNLPAASATIAKGANSAVLKLTVPDNVPPGNYTILVRGTGPFPFNKDPNAKDKPNVNVNEPSNPIALTIRR